MADVSATKSGSSDREIWLNCFSSALTGLLSGNQAVAYEPEQVIRQAGKLADIALTKVQVRHSFVEAEAPGMARTPGLGTPAAALLGERGAAAAAAKERSVGDALDPAESGQPQTQTRSSAFPFYASDFLAATGLLSTAAVGGYIRMLANAWSNGPIPDSPKALARAMNHSAGDPPFEEIWAELKSKWFLTKRGWINCRLEVVRWERAIFLEKQSKTVAAQVKPQPAATPSKETRTEPRVSSSTATAGASRR
jgi:uncharacterized protein YdaU (DUF1376 family)